MFNPLSLFEQFGLLSTKYCRLRAQFHFIVYSMFELKVGSHFRFMCVFNETLKSSQKIYDNLTAIYDHIHCLCPCQRQCVVFRKIYSPHLNKWVQRADRKM